MGDPIQQYQVPIVVRLKYGAELNGMQVHQDGVAFHSPSPIAVGKLVELILCGGSILVDAEIIECVQLSGQPAGFGIRAKYHEASDDMRELIAHEVRRAMQEV
jgi:hypothetical protein